MIYILLVVISSFASDGGFTVIQQEFSSRETCESALTSLNADLEKASKQRPQYSKHVVIQSQGCFKK